MTSHRRHVNFLVIDYVTITQLCTKHATIEQIFHTYAIKKQKQFTSHDGYILSLATFGSSIYILQTDINGEYFHKTRRTVGLTLKFSQITDKCCSAHTHYSIAAIKILKLYTKPE